MKKLSVLILLGLLSLFQSQVQAQLQAQTKQPKEMSRISQIELESGNFIELDVTSLDSLQVLRCSDNKLQTLDVSFNIALQILNCAGNQLTNLDVGNNIDLQTLECNNNKLPNLDVRGCIYLKTLNCSNNTLSNLNVVGLMALSKLDCSNNRLEKLLLKNCIHLIDMSCSNNQLTSLDIYSTYLKKLDCSNNHLRKLQVGNDRLQTFHAQVNHLPLSLLDKFRQSADRLFFWQFDTLHLAVCDTLDLSKEMNVGSVIMEWILTDSDGLEVEEGSFEQKSGIFRFYKKGDYSLVLQNTEVRDNKGIVRFTWALNVRGDAFDITLLPNKTNWGKVIGSGKYAQDSMVTITAMASSGYRFLHWKKEDAMFCTKPDTTFKVIENLVLTAYFEKIPTYRINLQVNNDDWGVVRGNGNYREDEDVTITAIPNAGCRFLHWKMGDEVFSTQSTHTFKVSENLTLTAYFDRLMANELHQENKMFVYAKNHVIHLSEPMGAVQVFNAFGQCVYEGTATNISVKTSGLYMVRTHCHIYKVMVK